MTAPQGVETLDREHLVWMLTQMLRIREFEERVKRTFEDHPGVIRGHTHLADGAEASIVGSIANLGPDDQFFTTYRCHGYPIARGTDPNAMMAEIYGRKTCPNDVCDLDRLIAMARAEVVAPSRYNFIAQRGQVRTRTGLNVRRGAPTTLAPVLRAAPANEVLDYVGWTSNGMSVNGNPHWYRDEDGNYFWSGATTRPIPGIAD